MCMVGLLVGCEGNEDTVDDGNSLNWSLFRGDASLSGYTDRSLPKKPSLLWSYKSGVRTVSSPIVHQGTTYWCDKKGHIWGIDLKGEPVFGYDLDTPVEAIPMVYDSVLYIGRLDGWMSAISLESRDTLWNFETMGQISASPNRVGFEGRKAIVFGSYDNYLYCVDERTGQEINRFESGYYLNGAVALWKKHVLFGGCDSWIRVINCKTGLQTDSLLMIPMYLLRLLLWGIMYMWGIMPEIFMSYIWKEERSSGNGRFWRPRMREVHSYPFPPSRITGCLSCLMTVICIRSIVLTGR